MDTLESNKMIAEFMPDMKLIIPNNQLYGPYYRQSDDDGLVLRDCEFPNLRYHDRWNWLMPVVAEIEGLMKDGLNWDYCVTIERDYCCVSHNGESIIVEGQGGKSKISRVYHVVVLFIEWHNKQVLTTKEQ